MQNVGMIASHCLRHLSQLCCDDLEYLNFIIFISLFFIVYGMWHYMQFTTRPLKASELLLRCLIIKPDKRLVHQGQFPIVSTPLLHPASEVSGMDQVASDKLFI